MSKKLEYQEEIEEILTILGLPKEGEVVPQILMEDIDAVLYGVAERAREAAVENHRPIGVD